VLVTSAAPLTTTQGELSYGCKKLSLPGAPPKTEMQNSSPNAAAWLHHVFPSVLEATGSEAFLSSQAQSPLSCGRGAAMLLAPWRSALLLALQKLINRFGESARNRNVLSRCNSLQTFHLFRLESYSGELLFHIS